MSDRSDQFDSPHAHLSRLSLNTATLKRATLAQAVEAAARAGYGAVGLWRDRVHEVGAPAAATIVRDAGLRVSSLCRGGWFTASDAPGIARALDENRRAIDEAATLGTNLILVVGGLPANPGPGLAAAPGAGGADRSIVDARARVAERLADLAPYARERHVRLVLEPMNPIFAADRGVLSTVAEALELAKPFAPSEVGVVVDTYHVWWDPALAGSIARAGREGRLAGYHVSDWSLPLHPVTVNSRGYVGDGYIDFPRITRWMREAGYAGFVETEIFNEDIWARPFPEVAETVARRYLEHVEPYLR